MALNSRHSANTTLSFLTAQGQRSSHSMSFRSKRCLPRKRSAIVSLRRRSSSSSSWYRSAYASAQQPQTPTTQLVPPTARQAETWAATAAKPNKRLSLMAHRAGLLASTATIALVLLCCRGGTGVGCCCVDSWRAGAASASTCGFSCFCLWRGLAADWRSSPEVAALRDSADMFFKPPGPVVGSMSPGGDSSVGDAPAPISPSISIARTVISQVVSSGELATKRNAELFNGIDTGVNGISTARTTASTRRQRALGRWCGWTQQHWPPRRQLALAKSAADMVDLVGTGDQPTRPRGKPRRNSDATGRAHARHSSGVRVWRYGDLQSIHELLSLVNRWQWLRCNMQDQ